MSTALDCTGTAYDRLLDALRDHGSIVEEPYDGRAVAQCPAHDDRNPSLSVKRIEGSVLLFCHANCAVDDVLGELGLAMRDLFDERNGAAYVYPDGRVNHRAADKKDFWQTGNTKPGTKGASLFHAECIGDSPLVFVPEGEKDCLAIEAIGGVAVCSPMGAGKAAYADWTPLRDKYVMIIADKDDAGRKHAHHIARLLHDVPAAGVDIRQAAVGKDAADHIAAGKGLGEFVALSPREDVSEPVPLINDMKPLPPFPVDALPAAVAAMVNAVAEATQTDPAMAATSALSVLAGCAGGHAEIEIRRGWREPLNLYTATVAAPGERKSAVQQAMARPLYDVEARLTETMMPARLEALARKQIAEKAAEKALTDAVRTKGDGADKLESEDAAIQAAKYAHELDVPVIPRLIADDVTPESLASLLAEQKGRLAVISAEGGVFDIIAGRYNGNVPNMDVWLKGHSGDPIRVDRKGRPPEHIQRPALTLGLMIQPDVLKTIAGYRQFRGRGLLARFLYAMPVSKVGRRAIATDPMPDEVVRAYTDHVSTLVSGLAGWAGDPAVLMLTESARKAMQAIEAGVEPTLADDGELAAFADWGAKLCGVVARIAGVIHLATHGSDDGVKEQVDAVTIRAAYRMADYYRTAAVYAFAVMSTDPVTTEAQYLLSRIETIAGDGDEVTERDMQRVAQRFPTKEAMTPAVRRLIDHGYLIPQQQTNRAKGGRPPSPRFTVRSSPA